ncbi:unnamed protein product [Sphagnum troendelagicum]
MVGHMTEYAPLVGFDTLHDYPVSRTGAELESVFPGATQMSGRSLYLSVSQIVPPVSKVNDHQVTVIPNAFMKDIWNNPYQSIWTIALALHFLKVQVL